MLPFESDENFGADPPIGSKLKRFLPEIWGRVCLSWTYK
jgi:hypothetical protein